MALIREIVSNAVHWRMPGTNATNAANEALKRLLPPNLLTYFARLQINSQKYEWHAEGLWKPLSAASDVERATVLALVESATNAILPNLARVPNGENLIKRPNDEDYIFFGPDENGVIRIIFTGWGFENSRTIGNKGGVVASQTPPQLVRIGFASEGQVIPNREFTLNVAGTLNARTTGAEGYFNVGMVPEGTSLNVTDAITGRLFTVDVQAGVENYVYDVTEKSNIIVTLKRDGEPCQTDELVTVNYNGNTINLTSVAGEPATTTVTLKHGEEATVCALGEEQTRELKAGDNHFTFNLDTPKAIVRIKMTHADGTPYVAEQASVSYAEGNYTVITDEKGEATLQLNYAQGQMCVVTTSIGTAQRQLRPAYEELFEFTEEAIPEPDPLPYNLRFIDGNEQPHSNIAIEMKQGDREWATTLDENGSTVLPYGLFAIAEPIDITMHCPDTRIDGVQLTLDADEYEYLIQTKEKRSGWAWWMWLLLILLGLILVGGTGFGLYHACRALEPWAISTFFS